jgi:hypothetical protein
MQASAKNYALVVIQQTQVYLRTQVLNILLDSYSVQV